MGRIYQSAGLRALGGSYHAGRRGGSPASTAMTSDSTIVHLSDLHLSAPSPSFHPKRALAYLSWRLRRRSHFDREAFAALPEDIRGLNPSGAVITGDLTQLGLPSEYQQVADWLPQLGDSSRISLVPGNHDVTRAEPPARTLALWEQWIGPPGGPAGQQFPSVREIGDDLVLVGLSSARPSLPTLAVGTLGSAQLESLKEVLDVAGAAGRFRIVFLHHPPCEGDVGWRKRLTDAEQLRCVLNSHGTELVLHGHAHRPLFGSLVAAGRSVPVIGAPSASESNAVKGRRPRYNAYRIARVAAGWELDVSVRAWNARERAFEVDETRRLSVSSPENLRAAN